MTDTNPFLEARLDEDEAEFPGLPCSRTHLQRVGHVLATRLLPEGVGGRITAATADALQLCRRGQIRILMVAHHV